MRNTVAIMQRELLALFYSPIAYVVLCVFLFSTGLLALATGSFRPGEPATLRGTFFWMPFVLAAVIPAISMRMISEEYRSGTIETLMTAPVSDGQLVVGKYLAALVFYVLMLAGTVIYLVLLMMFGNPEVGTALASYLGLLLLGMAFMAWGLFTSSITRNQIVAWIVAAIPLVLFVALAFWLVSELEGWSRDAFQKVNILRHLDQFNRGLVTLESVVFFLATTLFFLFLTVKVVESRRWR
jgi:ABC-2 type transport system permease protein